MLLNYILLQEAAAPAGGFMGTWGLLLIMVVIFYFFMIRPQTKKQKEIKKFREGLKSGDPVITAGGILGKVRDIKDNYMLIEVADGVKIRVSKDMIYPTQEEAAQAADAQK